jgi:hypothetical protein
MGLGLPIAWREWVEAASDARGLTLASGLCCMKIADGTSGLSSNLGPQSLSTIELTLFLFDVLYQFGSVSIERSLLLMREVILEAS